MIRALVIVIVAGFLTSVACLAAALALGGPEIARSAWSWDWSDATGPHRFVWRSGQGPDGAESRRDFAWGGGERLQVDAPAEIDYVQAPGPAKLTIGGPAAELDRVQVRNGQITLGGGLVGPWRKLHITLSAPDVSRFELSGADTLRIRDYDQDKLAVTISGKGDVEARGQARSVQLNLSGAGAADLAELKTAGAEIDISGAGKATVGPTDWARLQISGVGEVELTTRPARLETHISGAGRVRQPGSDSVTAGASGDDDEDRGPARPT